MTTTPTSSINVIMSNNADEIRSLVELGFCPIECSIGGESIVDKFVMDHHGENSHLESVAIRAYRDHYGARKDMPLFVVTGTADADACFAIAALAGLLPHPAADVSGLPPFLHAAARKSLAGLAQTVAIIDTDPIGRDIVSMPMGEILLAWNALMVGVGQEPFAGNMGAGLWKALVSGHPAHKAMINAAKTTEAQRRAEASGVAVHQHGAYVGIVEDSPVFGFDVWYGRQPEKGVPTSSLGWKFPVVVAFNQLSGNITVGCPNKNVAQELFGVRGLMEVFPLLGSGWGGRETIGGSPRGAAMTVEQAHKAAQIINTWLVGGAVMSVEQAHTAAQIINT